MEFQSAHLLLALLVFMIGGVAITESGRDKPKARKVSAVSLGLISGAVILLPLAHEGHREARTLPGWKTYTNTVEQQLNMATRDIVTKSGHLVDIESSEPVEPGTAITYSCPPYGEGEYCKIATSLQPTSWTPAVTGWRLMVSGLTSLVFIVFVLYRNGWMTRRSVAKA